jgi:dynein heavy chain
LCVWQMNCICVLIDFLACQVFQVRITRTYLSQQFHDDLKLLYQAAGIGENKQQVVFLFDDTQVVEETFLEDINNILSTGEVGRCCCCSTTPPFLLPTYNPSIS